MENLQESEVSDHDDTGNARPTRNERREEAPTAQNGITRTHDRSSRAQIGSNSRSERALEINAQSVDALASEVNEDVEALFSIAKLSSGPIPDAEELDKYSPEVQAKIIEWHDREVKAVFDDESKRQDKLANAEVRQGDVGQWLSFVLDILLIVGPLVAFYFIRDPSVFWAYTILGANVIGNVVINIGSKKTKRSRRSQEDEPAE